MKKLSNNQKAELDLTGFIRFSKEHDKVVLDLEPLKNQNLIEQEYTLAGGINILPVDKIDINSLEVDPYLIKLVLLGVKQINKLLKYNPKVYSVSTNQVDIVGITFEDVLYLGQAAEESNFMAHNNSLLEVFAKDKANIFYSKKLNTTIMSLESIKRFVKEYEHISSDSYELIEKVVGTSNKKIIL